MSFAKLLAAGRSIINSGGSVTYRENKNVFLPKFESAKNPFAKTAPAVEPAQAPAPAPAKTATMVSAAVRPAASTRTAPWSASLNPLAIFRGAPPVRPVKAEQTELSLDTVRVMGNDLSDADVDVVPPLKARPTRKKGQGQGPPPEEWGEVGNGVLGANLV